MKTKFAFTFLLISTLCGAQTQSTIYLSHSRLMHFGLTTIGQNDKYKIEMLNDSIEGRAIAIFINDKLANAYRIADAQETNAGVEIFPDNEPSIFYMMLYDNGAFTIQYQNGNYELYYDIESVKMSKNGVEYSSVSISDYHSTLFLTQSQYEKENSKKKQPFQIVESMPEFRGGDEAMYRFIQKNVIYPDSARNHDITGKVVVTCVVNEDGSLTDIKIKKSVSWDIDKEALRVVELLQKKFKPARAQGKSVTCSYMLPIAFTLKN